MPERTLVLTSNQLIVVARNTATASIEITAIPLAFMIAFEWGVILLYSWIEIVWVDSGLRHTRFEFNTVGEDYLRLLLAALQQVVLAHEMLNSHGNPTVEMEVRPAGGAHGRAAVHRSHDGVLTAYTDHRCDGPQSRSKDHFVCTVLDARRYGRQA
jgi:hypothetical protein